MARPDRGGPRDDPNSPGGRQFKIIIGCARPNRSYMQHISRRLNTTLEPLQTSHQACAQTTSQAQSVLSISPDIRTAYVHQPTTSQQLIRVQKTCHTQALRRHKRKQNARTKAGKLKQRVRKEKLPARHHLLPNTPQHTPAPAPTPSSSPAHPPSSLPTHICETILLLHPHGEQVTNHSKYVACGPMKGKAGRWGLT